MSFLLTLHLADDALMLGHRNSEWTGHGPNLEQDIAVSNIALDLIGQARNFYQYAALQFNDNKHLYKSLIHSPAFQQVVGEIDEDDLAYLRDVREYRNHLLVELNKGDWAVTITKQFFFSAYQQLLYTDLQTGGDSTLAGIAEKALKEVNYHLRWSGEWVIRLGDGTTESHRRMAGAISLLWPYTGELFQPSTFQLEAVQQGLQSDPVLYRESWMERVLSTFNHAGLQVPDTTWTQQGGKDGIHTEQLGYLLADLQYLQRSYPNSEW